MLSTFLSLFVMVLQGYETQAYKVVERFDPVEIRYYPPAMKVKVESALSDNRNFNALFRYISGNNVTNEKIAMTTPVYMHNSTIGQTMEFVLPARFNEKAPQPKGKGVEVYRAKAGYFAAIRYGGYSTRDKEKNYTKKLVEILEAKAITVVGSPALLSYDAPYKFYNRRNEILVEIEQ